MKIKYKGLDNEAINHLYYALLICEYQFKKTNDIKALNSMKCFKRMIKRINDTY